MKIWVYSAGILFLTGVAVWIGLVIFPTSPAAVYDLDTVSDVEMLELGDQLSPEIMEEEFQFLTEKIKAIHPDPERHISGEWDKHVAETAAKLTEPLPAEIYAGYLAEFTAGLNDAHTAVFPSHINRRALPLQWTWTAEGYILSSPVEGYLEQGDRLVNVGDMDMEQVSSFINTIVSSENHYWVKVMTANYLQDEFALSLLDAVDGDDVTLTVEKFDGTVETGTSTLKDTHDS